MELSLFFDGFHDDGVFRLSAMRLLQCEKIFNTIAGGVKLLIVCASAVIILPIEVKLQCPFDTFLFFLVKLLEFPLNRLHPPIQHLLALLLDHIKRTDALSAREVTRHVHESLLGQEGDEGFLILIATV